MHCDHGGALYDATKFSVAAVSEVLSLEMKPFGIESMVVEPGMFRTNFFDGTSSHTPDAPLEAYNNTPARGAKSSAWATITNNTATLKKLPSLYTRW